MSEPPSPPPFPATPAPPPPGYAAYQPTNWGRGLSRIKPMVLWLTILLGLSALGQLASLPGLGTIRDASRDYLAGNLTDDQFDDKFASYGIVGLLIPVTQLAIIVLSIIWLYRVVRNHQTLGRQLRWAPGWAIAGWFVPPFVFVIPALVLRESWNAADPTVPPGAPVARRSEQPWIWIWFAVYVVAQTVVTFAAGSPFDQFSRERSDLAERFADNFGVLVAQSIIGVLSAVAWYFVIREISKRHMALTGEDRAR
jgi:hypothetical protein